MHTLSQQHPFLANEPTLDQFISNWLRGALPKASWTHAAHIATAAYYAFDHEPPELFQRMRSGILRFNESTGTANTEDSGYHETITRFWCGIIAELGRREQASSRFALSCKAVETFGEKRDLHNSYYSFNLVKDRRARREWVAPDQPLPFFDPCS